MDDDAGGRDFLGMFWTLSDADPHVRRHSACAIVNHLLSSQKQQLPDAQSTDLQYAMKRLLRGMCSSRECARQGFASVLSELLASLPCIKVQDALARLLQCTEVEGSMRAHEQRDFYVGRVFGFMALHRSGRLKGLIEPGAKSTCSIVSKLVELGRRQFLRQLCFELIIAIVNDSTAETVAKLLSLLLPALDGEIEEYNPDQLSLAIALQRKIASLGPTHCSAFAKQMPQHLQPHGSNRLVRSSKDGEVLKRLVVPLRMSSSCFPKVHSVWDSIVRELTDSTAGNESQPDPGKHKMDTLLLGEFWPTVVEPALLNSTHERRGLLMLLIQKLLPHLTPAQIPLVFTPPCVRCIMNNVKDKKNYLHPQALNLLHRMGHATQNLRVPLVSALLTNGGVHFDQTTKTKTVAKLLEGTQPEALDRHTLFLEQLICNPADHTCTTMNGSEPENEEEEDEELRQKKLDTNRILAVEALATTTRNPKIPQPMSKRVEVLAFLMVQSLFEPSTEVGEDVELSFRRSHSDGLASCGIPEPPLSAKVRSTIYNRFLGMASEYPSMAAVLAQPEGSVGRAVDHGLENGTDAKVSAPLACAAAHKTVDQLWPWALHHFYQQLIESGAQPYRRLSNNMQQQRRAMIDTAKRIQRLLADPDLTAVDKQQLLALHRLLLLVGLQQLQEFDDELAEEAAETVGELRHCFAELYKERFEEAAFTDAMQGESQGDDATDPVLVIVEILLQLLTQPSSFLRKSIKELFRSMSGRLTEASLQAILHVVCADQTEDELDDGTTMDDSGAEGDGQQQLDERGDKGGNVGVHGETEEQMEEEEEEEEEDDDDDDKAEDEEGTAEEDGEQDVVLDGDQALDQLREGAADEAMAALARLRFERSGGREKQRRAEQLKFRSVIVISV